jgi:tRNA threonylcarbamoyladenosine modification (KEOPS) complex  Pcc1 subunit
MASENQKSGKQEQAEQGKQEQKTKQVSGSASILLNFGNAHSAKSAYHSLLQEADFSHRGGSKVKLMGKTVAIEILADDPVSLRASINSYLRLAHIIKTIEQDTK